MGPTNVVSSENFYVQPANKHNLTDAEFFSKYAKHPYFTSQKPILANEWEGFSLFLAHQAGNFAHAFSFSAGTAIFFLWGEIGNYLQLTRGKEW
jgi:hypothetical protein